MKNIRIFIFFIVFVSLAIKNIFSEKVEIKANLLSPSSQNVITRHPQIVIKYLSDISPIIKTDSIRFLVNNIDYTNYIRIDLSTPELIITFYSTKPLDLGKNIIKVTGKLINDDIFENEFIINVNPRLSNHVAHLLDAIKQTNSNSKKSEYYYKLGFYYEQNGYFLDALGYYEQSLILNKNNTYAKKNYEKILSLFPNKAKKIMNIVLDVSFINIDVLKRNKLYLFRCVIENYRDSSIEFNLNNFLLSSKSSYYQPLKNPYEYLRKMVQKNLMTLDDFAISSYLLSKDSYYLEYPDNFVIESYSQLRIDLMFNTDEKEVVFHFFKPYEKLTNKKQKELPIYFKIPFIL